MKNLLMEQIRKEVPYMEFFPKFLEAKLYCGPDVYCDSKTSKPFLDSRNTQIRTDSNQSIGMHNDLQFNDLGVHDPNDSASGDAPTVTISIGSARDLSFVQKYKTGLKWKERRTSENVTFALNHGDIFVLLPNDECPKRITKNILFKTQHRATFSGNGVSVALVFRTLTTKSLFERGTDTWLYKDDSKYRKEALKKINEKQIRCQQLDASVSKSEPSEHKPSEPPELNGILGNMKQSLKDCWMIHS